MFRREKKETKSLWCTTVWSLKWAELSMPSQIHRGIFEDQRDMHEVFQKQVKEPTKLSTR